MTDINKKDIIKIEDLLKQIKIDPEKAKHGDNMWSVKQGSAIIFIITAGGFVIFQSPIMEVPKQNLATLYRKLLELNEDAGETLGTSFGISVQNEIVLKSLYPLKDLNFNTFSYSLTSIAHVADKYCTYFREKFNF